MNQKTRDLTLWVVDDCNDALPLVFQLSHYKRYDDILVWLIKNNLIGFEFVQWSKHLFGHSTLSMAKHILRLLHRDTEDRPILYGRDIV